MARSFLFVLKALFHGRCTPDPSLSSSAYFNAVLFFLQHTLVYFLYERRHNTEDTGDRRED